MAEYYFFTGVSLIVLAFGVLAWTVWEDFTVKSNETLWHCSSRWQSWWRALPRLSGHATG